MIIKLVINLSKQLRGKDILGQNLSYLDKHICPLFSPIASQNKSCKTANRNEAKLRKLHKSLHGLQQTQKTVEN